MTHQGFQVPLGRHMVTAVVHYTRWMWRWLGKLETTVLKNQLEAVEIKQPIYISGLARSGSTILLRIISSHPEVITHQYRDFPFLFVPFWWQQTLNRQKTKRLEPKERAHRDRIKVTPRSPESMEEALWMAHFDELHDPGQCNVLDEATSNERFESFYRNHIRKLLVARDGSRYAAKANYNIIRLEYLLRVFNEPRFVIPVRHPRAHVASSRKQQRLFCDGARKYPRAVSYLRRVGHFEFGPDRRPINAGDTEVVRSIRELWSEGREVRGWARYWAHIYGYLMARLDENDALDEASLLVRYEDLCESTRWQLERIINFCGLQDYRNLIVEKFADSISAPSYYAEELSKEEKVALAEETREIAGQLDYSVDF